VGRGAPPELRDPRENERRGIGGTTRGTEEEEQS